MGLFLDPCIQAAAAHLGYRLFLSAGSKPISQSDHPKPIKSHSNHFKINQKYCWPTQPNQCARVKCLKAPPLSPCSVVAGDNGWLSFLAPLCAHSTNTHRQACTLDSSHTHSLMVLLFHTHSLYHCSTLTHMAGVMLWVTLLHLLFLSGEWLLSFLKPWEHSHIHCSKINMRPAAIGLWVCSTFGHIAEPTNIPMLICMFTQFRIVLHIFQSKMYLFETIHYIYHNVTPWS